MRGVRQVHAWSENFGVEFEGVFYHVIVRGNQHQRSSRQLRPGSPTRQISHNSKLALLTLL